MEGEGMVAVVRGLRDSGLAVTLLDGSRQYTLIPNSISHTTPRHSSPVTNSNVSTQQSPAKTTADSSTDPSFPLCDSSIQAVDGRYASTYRTSHCHVRPTSPPVQLAEFPPQRPEICPGRGNFQVGGLGSGITHAPIKSMAPTNFRGGLCWPDRGSVCTPRPSHEPDAFANSLRKYPNLSPDRSSEVVERLINYSQAKGISRTFPRNQGSPTRLPEPSSHHTFDLKGCPRSSRLYEPEILIRSAKKEELPTRDKKKDEHLELRLRSYDVRCIRDMSKRLRESVKTMSSYPSNPPVCPTIKEINHCDQVYDQSSVNSVNMEIQAAVKMISREVATVQRDKPPGKTVAVPDSPPASSDERNAEGDCPLDPSLNTHTSFKSIQTTSCSSDSTLKPRKSAQTVFSSIDVFSRPNRPKSTEGRKSKSQEEMKVTNDDLRRSLLELIKDVSTCTKSKKRIRDELIKKLFDADITEKYDSKRESEKFKRERCHKYVSTYWPSGCDFVGDFEELLNKLKHWNGDSRNRSDKYNIKNTEYKQLDFVLKDWISSLNIKNEDNLDRGDVLNSLEDQIKSVFKDRTKRDFDLKAEVVRIIGQIPIEVNSGYTKSSYLHRLVDVLFRRLKSVVVNQQHERNKKLLNKSKKIFSKHDLKDFLKTHLTGLFEECNIDICDNVMHALQNDLRDILMDSIDCIRCGHLDDARDEMKVLFQDLGLLTDTQRDYVIKVILQNLQVMLNDHNYSYTYTILHSTVSGQNSRNANGPDASIDSVTEGDLNANLDFYTNQLSIKIHEWLDTLNIPQIQDRGFREVVVNDLAGDIVDRHKYLELNPKVRGSEEDELETLKYQIFKWINKLVGEDNTETIAHAKDLMMKIKSVALPMLTNPDDENPMPFDPMRPCLNEKGATCRKEKPKNKQKTPSCTKENCLNAPRSTPSPEKEKRKPCCSSASCQYSSQIGQDVTDRKPCYTDVSTSVQSYPGHSLHSAQISQGGYVPQGSYGQDSNRNQGQVRISQAQYGPQGPYGLDPNQNQSQFGQGVYGGPQDPDPNQDLSQFSQGRQSQYGHDPKQNQSQFRQGTQGQYGHDPNEAQSQFIQGPQGQHVQYPNHGKSQSNQGPQGQYGHDPNQDESQLSQGPQGQYGQDPNQGHSQLSQGPQDQYGHDTNQGQSQLSRGPQGQYGQDPNQDDSQLSHGPQDPDPNQDLSQFSQGRQSQYGHDPKQNQSQFRQGTQGQYGHDPNEAQSQFIQGPQGQHVQYPNHNQTQSNQGPQGQYGHDPNHDESQLSQGPQGQYGQDPNQGHSQLSQGPQDQYGHDTNQGQSQLSRGPQGQYGQDPNQDHSQLSHGPQDPDPNQDLSQFSQGRQSQYGHDPKQNQSQFGQGTQGQYGHDPNEAQSQFIQGPQGQHVQYPNHGQSQSNQGPQGQYGQDPNQDLSQFSHDAYGLQGPHGLDPNQDQLQISQRGYGPQEPYGLNQGQITQGAYGPQGSYGLGPDQGQGYFTAPGTYGQNGPYAQADPVGPPGEGDFGPQNPNQQWDMPPMYQPGMSGPEGNYQGGPGSILITRQGIPVSGGPGSAGVQGLQHLSPQGQIQHKKGYSIGAGLVNTGEACCPFQEFSVLSPSVKHLNDHYDGYLKDWVHRIPIAASNPEEQDAAEKNRLAFYNGIWKAITKLRLDPEIFSNPYYYQDQFDDEIDALFATVPKSKELDDVKDKLKTELLEKTVAVNNYIKTTNTNASFKQQIIESIENNLPKRINAVNLEEFIQQNEEVLKIELAEYFILYMRFKDEDNLKANVYKKNFLRKLEQFLNILKTNYGADLKQANTYATDTLNSLDKIPILNKYVLQDEADDILLSIEVENWLSDLPVTPAEIGPLEKRRIRDSIVKKVQEVGKIVAYTDCIFSKPLKDELPKILSRLPIKPGTNLDFMIEELSNRVKYLTRSTRPKSNESRNYKEFSNHVLDSSSLMGTSGQEASKFVVGNIIQSNGSKNWPNFSAKGFQQQLRHSKDQSKAAPTIPKWGQVLQNYPYQADEQNNSGQQPVIENNLGSTYLDPVTGAAETYFISEIPSSGFQPNTQGTTLPGQTNVQAGFSPGNQTNVQRYPSSGIQTNDQENLSSALQFDVKRTSSSGFKPYVQSSPSLVFQANVQETPSLGFQANVQGNPPSAPQGNLGLQENVQAGTEAVPFIVPCCTNLSCSNRPRALSTGISRAIPISQVIPDLNGQNQGLSPVLPPVGREGEVVANLRQYGPVPQDTYAQSSLATKIQGQSPYGQVITHVPGSPELKPSNAPVEIPQGTYGPISPIPVLPTGPNTYAQITQPQSYGPIIMPRQTVVNPGKNISSPSQQSQTQGSYGQSKPVEFNQISSPTGQVLTSPVDILSTNPLPSQVPQGSSVKNVPIHNRPQSYNPISASARQVKDIPDGKTTTAGLSNRAPQRANESSNIAASKKPHSNIPIPISRGKLIDSQGRQASSAARYSQLPQDPYGQSRSIPENQVQYRSPASVPAGQGKDGLRVKSPKTPRISIGPQVTDKRNSFPYNQRQGVGQATDGQGKVVTNDKLPNSAQTSLGPQGNYNQRNSVPYNQTQNFGPVSTLGDQVKVGPSGQSSNVPQVSFVPQNQRISVPYNQGQGPSVASGLTGQNTTVPSGQIIQGPQDSNGQRYAIPYNQTQNIGLPLATVGQGNVDLTGIAPNGARMSLVSQGHRNSKPYNQFQDMNPLLASAEQGNFDPRRNTTIAPRYSNAAQEIYVPNNSTLYNQGQDIESAAGPGGQHNVANGPTKNVPQIGQGPQKPNGQNNNILYDQTRNVGFPSAPVDQGKMYSTEQTPYNQTQEIDPLSASTEQNSAGRSGQSQQLSFPSAPVDQGKVDLAEQTPNPARMSIGSPGHRTSKPYRQAQKIDPLSASAEQNSGGRSGQPREMSFPSAPVDQVKMYSFEQTPNATRMSVGSPDHRTSKPYSQAQPPGHRTSKPYSQAQQIDPLSGSTEQDSAGRSGQSQELSFPSAPVDQSKVDSVEQTPNTARMSVGSPGHRTSKPYRQAQKIDPLSASTKQNSAGRSGQSQELSFPSAPVDQSKVDSVEQTPNTARMSVGSPGHRTSKPYSEAATTDLLSGSTEQDSGERSGQSQKLSFPSAPVDQSKVDSAEQTPNTARMSVGSPGHRTSKPYSEAEKIDLLSGSTEQDSGGRSWQSQELSFPSAPVEHGKVDLPQKTPNTARMSIRSLGHRTSKPYSQAQKIDPLSAFTKQDSAGQSGQQELSFPSAPIDQGKVDLAEKTPNTAQMSVGSPGHRTSKPYSEDQKIDPLSGSTVQDSAGRSGQSQELSFPSAPVDQSKLDSAVQTPNTAQMSVKSPDHRTSKAYNQVQEIDPLSASAKQDSAGPSEQSREVNLPSASVDQGKVDSTEQTPNAARMSLGSPGHRTSKPYSEDQKIDPLSGSTAQDSAGRSGQSQELSYPSAPVDQSKLDSAVQTPNTAQMSVKSPDHWTSNPYNQAQEIDPLSGSTEQGSAGPGEQSAKALQNSVASQDPYKQGYDNGTEPRRISQGSVGISKQSPNAIRSSVAAQNQTNAEPYTQDHNVGTATGPVSPNGRSQNGTRFSQNIQTPYTQTSSDPYHKDQSTLTQGQAAQVKQDNSISYQSQPRSSAVTARRYSQHMAQMSPEDVANYYQDPQGFFEGPLSGEKPVDTRRVSFHSNVFQPDEYTDGSKYAQPDIAMPGQEHSTQNPEHFMSMEDPDLDASWPSSAENPNRQQMPGSGIGVQVTSEMPGPSSQSACPTQTQPFPIGGPQRASTASTNTNHKPGFYKSTDSEANEKCYCRCGTGPAEQTPIEKEDNKCLDDKEKNIFNIKAVQTAFSTIDIHTTKCKYCEIRSKSQEELTKVTKRQEVIKRKDIGIRDLHPEITQWFEIYRDKVKVKMWGDKMQKLVDKLKTPGGEEKLRMKIEKYLKKVPDQFSDGDEDRQEFRKQLPDDIIRKLKLKYLSPTEPDVNVYRMELSKYCSRFKTEHFKKLIINWFKNLNIKKKDFLGRTVKKDDVLKYVTEKLEPLVLNRPVCDTEYKDTLKSNIIDIVEDLPLVIGRHNKEFVVNRVSDGLINDILNMETKHTSSYIQPTVNEIKEFVKDEITFFLEKAHKAISTKRMECLETELVDILQDLANISDIDNDVVEDITTTFKETGKLSEYKARYFSNILLRDYKEFFFRQSFFNEKGKIDLGHPDVYFEVQNFEGAENHDDSIYNVYSQQIVDEINKWICKINIPNKNKSLIGVVVKELAGDIVNRHKYLVMNPNYKRTDAEESELLKYEIFKWTSRLTGDDNTTVLDHAQELLDKINTIPKPEIPTTYNNNPTLSPTADLTFDNKPSIETLSDLICDWFEELPEEVYQYADLNSELVEDLAKDIYKNYDNIYPGLIDDMVDQWTDEVFNKKLNRNDAEKLKNRIKNNIQRHTKENEKKDPKQEKVIIRSYEDIVDDWIDTVPMDPKKVGHFIKNKNEYIHELALKIYQIKSKYNKAPNDVKIEVLQEGVIDWMKKLLLNIDAITSLTNKNNTNKYASKLVAKIQACNVNASADLRAALKEQLIVDEIKVAMMEWLKKLPLYTNNSLKAKEHQETIIKELAIKVNEQIRDGHNPDTVMFEHIKMLDPAQSDDIVKNTVSQLKLHLQNYQFGDLSLQLTDDDILLSNIEVWIENLHLDVRDITRFNDQKTEFINSMQRLRSSGSNGAVIKKEIVTFLRSIPLVNNRKLDENTLNVESLKLLKSMSAVQKEDPSSTSTLITNELICKTIKDWANTLALKPIYCPRELRWFIDDISLAITSLLNRLECCATLDNDQVINQEITKYLRRFPLLEQTNEKCIMTASNVLASKLKNLKLFNEGCYNDDARNVTVYGFALDSTNTTITSDTTDFSIESIKEDDINANLERYTKQVVRQITEWFAGLDLQNVQEEGFKEVVINDLAGDIVDRHKYLELNPKNKGSNVDELEHLKYQIFKWINKLVGEENLETIEHADELMARIQSIPVPMLVKPAFNITNTKMNSSMPACCTPKKHPKVLTAPNCCQPSYYKLTAGSGSTPVGIKQATQPATNVYPDNMSSPSQNTTEYSIEEVSGYGGTIEPLSPQAGNRISHPGPAANFSPDTTSSADSRSISVPPQTGRPSYGVSPQPTDKRISSPAAVSAPPQPGRPSFGVSSPATDKRMSSPDAVSALSQPGRPSFGVSSPATDKRMSSPAALSAPPQPGRPSFGVSSPATDKRMSSPAAVSAPPQPGRPSFGVSSPATDKRMSSPAAVSAPPQPGRPSFGVSSPATDKRMSSPAAVSAPPQPGRPSFGVSSPATHKRMSSPAAVSAPPQPGRPSFGVSSPATDKRMSSPAAVSAPPQPGRPSFGVSSPATDKRMSSPAAVSAPPQPGRPSFGVSSQPTDKITSSTPLTSSNIEQYSYDTPPSTGVSTGVSSQLSGKRMSNPNAMINANVDQYSPDMIPPAVRRSVSGSPQAGRLSIGKLMTSPDILTNVKIEQYDSDTPPSSAGGNAGVSSQSQPTSKRVSTPNARSNANETYGYETPPSARGGTFEVLKRHSIKRISTSDPSASAEPTPISSKGSSPVPASSEGTLEVLSPQSAKTISSPAAIANLNTGSSLELASQVTPQAGGSSFGMPPQPTATRMSTPTALTNSDATQYSSEASQIPDGGSTGVSSGSSKMGCCPLAISPGARVNFAEPPNANGINDFEDPSKCCPDLHSSPPLTPLEGTKEAIYEKYQKIFREKCNALQIDTSSPETEKLAELARTGLYNGIVKTFFKLKADPEIENDYGYFEFMLEEKIDEMLDVLPQTEDFKNRRHPWKIDILTNAIDMLDELHALSDRPSFRQRVRNKFNRKFAREMELEECFLLQQGFLAEMADAYILETNYKEDNPVKANIYKNRLMKKIDDLANHLAKEHNAGFRFFKKPQLAHIAMKVLEQVPIPSDDILKAEAEEIQLADEVEKWYKELPTKPLVNDTDGVLRKRMIDLLAKKLYDIDKRANDSEVSKEEQKKHEISQFLEKRAKLQQDQDLNINFMVDELNNRLKNRWLKDPVDYSDFENENPLSSTFAQVNKNEGYLAPLMDAATSTGQSQGQTNQDFPYESPRNRTSISQAVQSEPNQTYASQGVPMGSHQQTPPYSGYGPRSSMRPSQGYSSQSIHGVPFQSIPPNQPPDRVNYENGLGPKNTRPPEGYGSQQPQMMQSINNRIPGAYVETNQGEVNNGYIPQQNMRTPSRSGPGPRMPEMAHTCPRNMRLGSQSGHAASSPRMHCSKQPFGQCGGRHDSIPQVQVTEPTMNGQQRPYGMQGQVRHSTSYPSQGQNPSIPGYGGGYGPTPSNGVAPKAQIGPISPDGREMDSEYIVRCKCLEAYRRRRRCFEFDDRYPRYNPYRY